MREEIINIQNQAISQIMEAASAADLEEIRITYLGRSGKLATITKSIKELTPEKKKGIGLLINQAITTINQQLAQQKESFQDSARQWFDPTIPGKKVSQGHLHLVTQAIEEIADIFEKIGFVRVRYPEVEWDWYAFESLNMPTNHPARDEWETFFVDRPTHSRYGKMVLTPHTSSGQVREMQRVVSESKGKHLNPIRMINIAKCYRRQLDVSHVPMFHQFEGLVIDQGIAVTHLKGTLDYFAKTFFGSEREIRLRPFHFQFTEPSFEVDISCGVCGGKGCNLCKAGWLELGGAGMVHPNVLRAGSINPEKYSGFAFGWGVERTYMMKSGLKIDDIRTLYSSDLDYLKQF